MDNPELFLISGLAQQLCHQLTIYCNSFSEFWKEIPFYAVYRQGSGYGDGLEYRLHKYKLSNKYNTHIDLRTGQLKDINSHHLIGYGFDIKSLNGKAIRDDYIRGATRNIQRCFENNRTSDDKSYRDLKNYWSNLIEGHDVMIPTNIQIMIP